MSLKDFGTHSMNISEEVKDSDGNLLCFRVVLAAFSPSGLMSDPLRL